MIQVQIEARLTFFPDIECLSSWNFHVSLCKVRILWATSPPIPATIISRPMQCLCDKDTLESIAPLHALDSFGSGLQNCASHTAGLVAWQRELYLHRQDVHSITGTSYLFPLSDCPAHNLTITRVWQFANCPTDGIRPLFPLYLDLLAKYFRSFELLPIQFPDWVREIVLRA